MKPGKENILIIAASETDANLYYAARFLAPDPFAFIQIRGQKYVLMNDLELDRARREARGHRVLSLSRLSSAYQKKHRVRPTYAEVIAEFLKSQHVKNLSVPENFPIKYFDRLRGKGFKIKFRAEPFFEKRTIKTPAEIRAIKKVMRHTSDAMRAAAHCLKKSSVRKGKLVWQGKVLTSETLRKIIQIKLLESNCIALHTIVACGSQTPDPHERGTGPLYANQPIIIDIFPRDLETLYYGDLTRTFVKGKAPEKIKKMYAAVKEAQQIAFQMIRPRTNGAEIHAAIHQHFKKLGFVSGLEKGFMQGFFHGTGHGLGLEVHESPRVSSVREILKNGNVVTVEPGLYYRKIGGVRLEDVVVVTKSGCRNLTGLPKNLEI